MSGSGEDGCGEGDAVGYPGYAVFADLRLVPSLKMYRQSARCRVMLYPNILLLTLLAPGGGRGVVTLGLINRNETRSVPSPRHPTAHDGIGTIAARLQMCSPETEDLGDYDSLEMLCPFRLLYNDGIERLGAESARADVRWVSAKW